MHEKKKKILKRRPKTKALKRDMLRLLDLPEETEATTPKCTWIGKSEMLLENHMGVVHCGKQIIRMMTHDGIFEVQGETLELLEFAEQRAYIRGNIKSAGYLS